MYFSCKRHRYICRNVAESPSHQIWVYGLLWRRVHRKSLQLMMKTFVQRGYLLNLQAHIDALFRFVCNINVVHLNEGENRKPFLKMSLWLCQQPTSFPGSSLYLELRLLTCLCMPTSAAQRVGPGRNLGRPFLYCYTDVILKKKDFVFRRSCLYLNFYEYNWEGTSSLTARADDNELAKRVKEVNKILRKPPKRMGLYRP